MATVRSKICVRNWLLIFRMSLKPLVKNRAERAPFLSKSTFVPTVVTMRIRSIEPVSRGIPRECGLPVTISRMLRTPSVGQVNRENLEDNDFMTWDRSVNIGPCAPTINGYLDSRHCCNGYGKSLGGSVQLGGFGHSTPLSSEGANCLCCWIMILLAVKYQLC